MKILCLPEGNSISLQLNIDGLPVFKSSNSQFWPIMGMLDKPSIKDPFIIGLFFGSKKPSSSHEYLADFVLEMKKLETNGLVFSGNTYQVILSAVICDAPARAFVKNVKSHSGYHGCDKCTQHGDYAGKVIFPETDAPLRSDVQFHEMIDKDHHLGRSPLQDLNIGMVTQFPLDYMHLVCLGVMRKLLWLWMKGPLKGRISSHAVNCISDSLIQLQGWVPKEFARKPRGLREVDRWKATEFRQLLLYTGSVVFPGNLCHAFYHNFLLLHVAIYILVSPVLCHQYCNYAEELLVHFVTHYSDLYGKDNVVYNVHGLVHLADDVRKYGCLDNISAFPFENFMKRIKRMIRKPELPLQQVVHRLLEGTGRPESVKSDREVLKRLHQEGPVPHGFHSAHQYKEV